MLPGLFIVHAVICAVFVNKYYRNLHKFIHTHIYRSLNSLKILGVLQIDKKN